MFYFVFFLLPQTESSRTENCARIKQRVFGGRRCPSFYSQVQKGGSEQRLQLGLEGHVSRYGHRRGRLLRIPGLPRAHPAPQVSSRNPRPRFPRYSSFPRFVVVAPKPPPATRRRELHLRARDRPGVRRRPDLDQGRRSDKRCALGSSIPVVAVVVVVGTAFLFLCVRPLLLVRNVADPNWRDEFRLERARELRVGCDWVSEQRSRCTVKDADAIFAFENCKVACGSCDHECLDDATWSASTASTPSPLERTLFARCARRTIVDSNLSSPLACRCVPHFPVTQV